MARRPERSAVRRYSVDHLWVTADGVLVTIGVTPYVPAQLRSPPEALKLPALHASIVRNEPFGEIEGGKAICELVAPVTGVVMETNRDVERQPSKVADDPNEAWLLRLGGVDVADFSDLLWERGYRQYLERGAVHHPFKRRFSPPSTQPTRRAEPLRLSTSQEVFSCPLPGSSTSALFSSSTGCRSWEQYAGRR